jgi:hypothetical protein
MPVNERSVVPHATDLEAAWEIVHETLPARWTLGKTSRDILSGTWSVSAVGTHPGRGHIPQSVTGRGESEVEALGDLNDRLRGIPAPRGTRMDELRARLRLAYLDGAETWTRDYAGRSMTRGELGAVIDRFPR